MDGRRNAIREDAERWISVDKRGEWIKIPGKRNKLHMSRLIQNYRDKVAEIPDYILRAAKGQRKEPNGPKGIVDRIYASGYRLNNEAGWVRRLCTDKGKRKIAEWLERKGWKRDTPLQEGGITYPIWPKRHKFVQLGRLQSEKPEETEWERGSSLEEVPRGGNERTNGHQRSRTAGEIHGLRGRGSNRSKNIRSGSRGRDGGSTVMYNKPPGPPHTT